MAKKEAYYFSHDSNARNDEKVVALLMKHKWEGYGLYWALIEKLRESTCYKLTTDYNLIAYDLRTSNELIKSIVTGFGLFTIDEVDGKFWSERLVRSMEEKSVRAKKAAEKRWEHIENHQIDANAMQVHSKCMSLAMQKNAIKGKESKEKKSKVVVEEQPPPPPQFSMLFEMFKRASMGMGYEDDFLKVEIGKFINKYPNAIAAQSGSLVNSWVAYLNKQKQQEWKLSQKEGNEQTNTIAAAIKRQRENSAKRQEY